MATHDYIIDNSTGANVRADINNALAAIVSNNSSSSSPSTTYAYQWWADTSAGVLKIRNSANNAWIELLQLDGTLTLEDGSASTPALAFRDDLDTGIFSSAANTFDIATAGSKRLIVDSVGRVGIGNITPVSYNAFGNTLVVATSTNTGLTLSGNDASANYSGIQFSAGTTVRAYVDQQLNSTGRMRVFNMANGFLEFGTNNEVRMHISATGAVGIGTTSPAEDLHIVSASPFIRFTDTVDDSHYAHIGHTDGSIFIIDADPANAHAGSGISLKVDNSEVLSLTENDQAEFAVGSTVKFQRNTGGTNSNAVLFNSAGSLVVKVFFNNTTTSYITSGSDRTLKKNLENWTESVLPLFKNLTPQKFNFTQEEDSETKHKGFIAQDEVANFPEAYPKDPDTDKYLYAPNNMVVYLMKAIQELEAKVAALEAA